MPQYRYTTTVKAPTGVALRFDSDSSGTTPVAVYANQQGAPIDQTNPRQMIHADQRDGSIQTVFGDAATVYVRQIDYKGNLVGGVIATIAGQAAQQTLQAAGLVTCVPPSGDTSGAADAAAINAAFTQVAAAGGGTVKLLGKYYVNQTVLVQGLCLLEGYGATIRQVNGANLDAVVASPAAMSTGASVNYDAPLSVLGLVVDGNRAGQTAGLGNGILLGSGSNTALGGQTTVKDCRVFETMSNGVCISEVNLGGNGLVAGTAAPYTGEARVTDNKVYNAGANGVWMRGGGLGGAAAMTDGFMVNNIVGYCTHDAIRVDSAGGWLITGNHPYGVGLSGILTQGAFSTRIEDNYIEGIGVLDSAATHFSTSSAFSQAGTYAAGTTYGLNDVVVFSNVIYKSKVYGNVGNQPDTSPNQWGAYAGGNTVSNIACLSSQSARPVTIKGNQNSLGHASWALNGGFQYTSVWVQGPASGATRATCMIIGNDMANELQGAGTNTTAVKLSAGTGGSSGVNPFEQVNTVRGTWTSSRSAGSTCAPTGAVGAGASGGTGAAITVTGNNQAGNVSVTSGSSGMAAGALASVSYTASLAPSPRVVVTPRDTAAAQALGIYVTTSASGFTINCANAPAIGTTYKFDYTATQGA